MTQTQAEGRRPNRLIREKSPYLLQHAYNPVDWHPWGPEAFQTATREDKPVFLSIGYSTCYWCHVMERESFESPEIAALINRWFVPIKVDREERPDIDAVYMSAVQAMSGQGGWPMTVFLTPDGKPFWGATYVPPDDRWGRPGLRTILPTIGQAWRTRREELLRSSRSVTQAISLATDRPEPVALSAAVLEQAVGQFAHLYDATGGGFGPAPKFPRSHALSFLLRAYVRSRRAEVLAMVEHTLDAMARGGIHDQLGGGFHRYSTDERWLVPHFEKMLYDQALLARTYLEAFQLTGKNRYAEIAREAFEYVLRDLRDPAGGFYSAEDAGEVGKEGEFYVWTPEEIERALGKDEAALVERFYGVTAAGNFSADHASAGGSAPSAGHGGGEHGTTILSIEQWPEAFAQRQGMDAEQARRILREARTKLLAARNQRARPHRDDKILTDWNGLMIAALAYGGRTLHEPRYTQAAEAAADFVLTRMQREGRLLHRFRDGEASIAGFLDDHAFFAYGLTELYEATFEPRWLGEAVRLNREMVRLFWDAQRGGLLFSGAGNETLIAANKELYDGALPSGNSVAALNLVRLGLLTTDKDAQDRAEQLFAAFSVTASQAPHAFPQFLIALDLWLGPSREIVLAGDLSAADTRAMVELVHGLFLPRAVIALHPTGRAGVEVERLAPFLKEQQPINGRATAYVCENYVCRLPTTELDRLRALLE